MRDYKESVFYSIRLDKEHGFSEAQSELSAIAALGVDGVRIPCSCDPADPSMVAAEYGTPEEFAALAAEAKKRDLLLVMDFPIAWTTDQCNIFALAVAEPLDASRCCYFFRSGSERRQRGETISGPPNNWERPAGGSAWRRLPDGEYCLTLIARNCCDLDWENPRVRQWAVKTLHAWQERGVVGFCLLGTDLLAKAQELPDVEPARRGASRFPVELVSGRPEGHAYLRELRQKLFSRKKGLLFGEGLFAEPEDLASDCAAEAPEVDALGLACPTERQRPDPCAYKEELLRWQTAAQQSGGWMLTGISASGAPGCPVCGDALTAEAVRLLAMLNLTLRGTPVIADSEAAVDPEFFGRLIALRRKYPALTQGEFLPYCTGHRQAAVYVRTCGGDRLLVILNLSDRKAKLDISEIGIPNGVLLLGTHRVIGLDQRFVLLPWEGRIYLVR